MSEGPLSPRRVAIIQARMSSSRFPGKVLEPLCGRPMIEFMVERLAASRRLDAVVVATSTDSSDDRLMALCQARGIACVRGSLEDVLDRVYRTAVSFNAEHVVRLTGDCPLIDADLVDRALELLARDDLDYVSNVREPSFPDGQDVEAFTMAALEDAWRNASWPSEREHVTPYLRRADGGLRLGDMCGVVDMSALRWTVDHPDDLAHVTALLAVAGVTGPVGFDRFDLYRAIERAGLDRVVLHARNEGYVKSLAAEAGNLSGALDPASGREV